MYKYKMLIIFLFLLTIFCNVNAYINEAPLVGKVVYLDAGHGGVDPGAYYKDMYEEDINLSITLKLRDYLLTKGCTVYLTRDGDYDLSNPKARLRKRSDLSNRASLIDKSNADLYLLIHLNSSTSTAWKGAQVFYDDINKNNKDFALIFQKNFNSNLGSKREEKEIKNLYMYKNIKNVPGLLLEVGFISNANERQLLNKEWYQNKIVKVITKSVIDVLL